MICPTMSGVDLDGNLVKVECIKHECSKYTQVTGHNPNTGQETNEWKCADAWIPVLLIENSQQQRNTGAAIQSFRNEMVADNRAVLQIASNNPTLIPEQKYV